MTVEIGDVIDGKYQIVSLLGEGGMGAVYEGMNTRIHRRVAIKVLHANVATNDEAMTRFEREAQAAGRIGSEHIVEVLDLGDLPGGERYMVMEFLEGESLRDRMGRGPMAPREIATLSIGVLEGLKAAHAAGIIHRDLKPDNVFLLHNRSGKKDFVKIVDFGISKFSTMGGEFSMTRTGAVMGTPYYMAPEQAKGGSGVDHRVDLYAVGVILYQALVGKVPFDAETFNELLFKIVLETPPPLAERVEGLDPDFVSIVETGMAREASARYQTAQEFQDALRAWMGGDYVAAGRTIAGGTPALDNTALGPGAKMRTPVPVPEPGTQGAWANTGTDDGVPIKKGPGAALWAGIAAVALLGGGAAVLLSGSDAEEEAAAAARAEEEKAAAAQAAEDERQEALAALEEERRKAEEARKKAEEARLEAEKNKADLEAQKRAAEAAKEAEEKEKAARAAAARSRPAAPRPRPTSAPRPTAPAPRPAPAASPSGRPIRTDL